MRYTGPRTGTGRPRKWDEPTIHVSMRLPYSILQQIDEMTRPGISRTDVIVSLVQAASNAEVAKYLLRIKELEMTLEQEREEKQSLLEEREKFLARIEKLELENQALKQGRSVRSYQDALKLKELAKNAHDGVSWKALCAEVLGLRDEGKIKDLMKLAFVVRKNERNTWPVRFYPKDIATEFHGWVLARPKDRQVADIIDYELYREDTLKAAKGLAVGEAVAEKVPEVKKLKSGQAAERWVEMFFEVVYRDYMALINQKRGKEAKKFLEDEILQKLDKVLADIDPADWYRAILAVLEAHEEEWGDVFVSNLRRVVMRTLSKPVEVMSDV